MGLQPALKKLAEMPVDLLIAYLDDIYILCTASSLASWWMAEPRT